MDMFETTGKKQTVTVRPSIAALFLTACISTLGALTVLSAQPRAGLAEPPYPEALDAAAVVESKIEDLSREALLVGNGDLNGLLYERNGALCLRISKNDIWDARVDTSKDPQMLKVNVTNHTWTGGGHNPSYDMPYPTPRTAALLNIGLPGEGAWRCIRAEGQVNEWLLNDKTGHMCIEGAAGVSAGYRWTIASSHSNSFTQLKFKITGTPGAQYYVNVFDEGEHEFVASGWRNTPALETEVEFPLNKRVSAIELFVMSKDGGRAENRISQISLTGGHKPLLLPAGRVQRQEGQARLDLRRAVATANGTVLRALADRNVFLLETDQDISLEEIVASYLPRAELGETGPVKWLHMKMPGDADYAGMEYSVAVACKGSRKAVALVTSWDTKEPVRDAAIRLAAATVAAEPAGLIATHEAAWQTFWAASGVALDDPDFQNWWYRMAYWLRCSSKPGAMPVGLYTGSASDAPGWHGDYHHNYNAWQVFWTAFNINHPELAEPWVRYMNDLLPRLKWLAKTTYDCEGACVNISSFAFEPAPLTCTSKNNRQVAMLPWGYTLGMMGMSAQVLWYRHLYQPDRSALAKNIYPVVRETALFYCSFIEKCLRDAEGKAKVGPSYSPEHGSFGVDNVPFDLAYARYSLKAGIAAAGELACDQELVPRFRKALARLPAYPTAPDKEGKPVVVDWTGCTFRQIGEHNITVPAVPVFPGDHVTWFSSDAEKELFRNTLRQTRHRGLNSTIMLSVAKARLSMPEACDDLRNYYKPLAQPNGLFIVPDCGYYLVESVGLASAIGEFLLQSVDNVIRVFPCWPKEKDASFYKLRAQGGFLVTAEQKAGKIAKLEIISTIGGKMRLLNPWTGKIDELETKPNQTIKVNP